MNAIIVEEMQRAGCVTTVILLLGAGETTMIYGWVVQEAERLPQPIANAGSDPNQTVTFYLTHASNADGAFFMKPVLIGTSIFDPQTLTIVYVMGLSASESEVPT